MTVNGNDGEFKGDANIIEVPSLTQALQDENRSVRATAAWALENIGTDAVPALIQTLKDPDSHVLLATAVFGWRYRSCQATLSKWCGC